MRVKLKIKHLAFGLLFVFAMLPIYTNFIHPELTLRQAVNEIQYGNMKGKQEIINLLNTTGSDSKKWQMIRDYMQEEGLYNPREYNVYITPQSTFSSSNEYRIGSAFTLEERVPYLQEYVENAPVDQFTISAATQLVVYYTSKEFYEKAEQLLIKTESRLSGTKWRSNERFYFHRVQLYVDQDKLDQAEERLLELQKKDYQSAEWVKLQVDISIKRGDLQLALQQLEEGMESYRQFVEEENKFLQDHSDNEGEASSVPILNTDFYSLASLKTQLERAIETGQMNLSVIKGKIKRSDGTPLANVGVFLRDDQNSNRSVMNLDPYQTRTRADGSYEIIGILSGSYQLGLGLSFQQVDGWTWPVDNDEWIDIQDGVEVNHNVTFQPLLNVIQPVNYTTLTDQSIRFEWEKVEGAAYYQIHLGVHYGSGSGSSPFQSNIKENFIVVDVQKLYSTGTGVSYGGSDGSSVYPESVLAFSNPEGEFSWSISAFDEEGQIITRSNGYRLNEKTMGDLPFFYLKERSITEADRLLLNGDIEEAFIQYRKDFEVNSNDLHALRMIRKFSLYKLIGQPLKENEELFYTKTMAEKQLSSNDIFDLVSYYYDNSLWAEYNEWYEIYQEYMRGKNQPTNEYVESLHAVALMRQGKLEGARDHFAGIIPQDKSHRFVGHWLALEIYIGTPLADVKVLSEKYPERSWSATDWRRLINSIEDEQLKTPLAKKYLHKGLSYHVQGEDEQLELYVDTAPKDIGQINIRGQKVFLKALLEIR